MPQQECPQDQLAEAQLLRHEHPHLLDGNAQHAPGRARHRAQVRTLPGQQADFAEELRRAVRRDNRLAWLAVPLDDPDLTCQHHDQVISHVPVGKQHLASRNVMLAAVPAQHLKLRRVQDRATPGLGLLRRTPGAPGGGARRRSRSVMALRAARTLRHHVPATSSQGEPPPGPGPQEPLCQPDTRATGMWRSSHYAGAIEIEIVRQYGCGPEAPATAGGTRFSFRGELPHE